MEEKFQVAGFDPEDFSDDAELLKGEVVNSQEELDKIILFSYNYKELGAGALFCFMKDRNFSGKKAFFIINKIFGESYDDFKRVSNSYILETLKGWVSPEQIKDFFDAYCGKCGPEEALSLANGKEAVLKSRKIYDNIVGKINSLDSRDEGRPKRSRDDDEGAAAAPQAVAAVAVQALQEKQRDPRQ